MLLAAQPVKEDGERDLEHVVERPPAVDGADTLLPRVHADRELTDAEVVPRTPEERLRLRVVLGIMAGEALPGARPGAAQAAGRVGHAYPGQQLNDAREEADTEAARQRGAEAVRRGLQEARADAQVELLLVADPDELRQGGRVVLAVGVELDDVTIPARLGGKEVAGLHR